MKKIQVIVLVSVLFLISCATMGRWESVDRVIINGQAVYIGQPQEAVEKVLGAPEKTQNVGSTDRSSKAGDKPFVMWFYAKYRIVFQDKVVCDILINTKQ